MPKKILIPTYDEMIQRHRARPELSIEPGRCKYDCCWDEEELEDTAPELRRYRANHKFVGEVGEFIRERTNAELCDFYPT